MTIETEDDVVALAQAMKQARAGLPINGIGAAIERTAKTYGQYKHTMIVTKGQPIVVTQH
jgi:methionine aminopeptidase